MKWNELGNKINEVILVNMKPIRQTTESRWNENVVLDILFDEEGYLLIRELDKRYDNLVSFKIMKDKVTLQSFWSRDINENARAAINIYGSIIDSLSVKRPTPFMLIGNRGFAYGCTRTLDSYRYKQCVVSYAKIFDHYCIMIIKTAKKYMAYETGGLNGNLNAVTLSYAVTKIRETLGYKPEGSMATPEDVQKIIDTEVKVQTALREMEQKVIEEKKKVEQIKQEIMGAIG